MAITINGTTGVAGVDGSNATPAIQGTDSNTGLSFGSDTVNINTGGSTRATINSSGKLIVGSTDDYAENVQAAFYGASNGGIALASGTSGLSRLMFADATSGNSGASVGSIIYAHSDNSLRFNINGGTERMRIDSSGRVLIGTSTDNGFKFKVSDGGGYEFAFAPNDSGVNSLVNYNRSGSAYVPFMVSGSDLRFASGGNTERMRLDSDGTLCIGTNTDHNTGDVISVTGSAHIMEIQNESTAGHRTITLRHARASGGTDAEQIVFEESGGGAVGSIQSNGSSTSYNTSSDYRLKENVTAISDGITRLKTLKPSRFNFKADKDTTVDGFLAHEVTAVPEAITGTKDQVATEDDIAYEKGDPIYQSIDQSKLVPLLTAALQEEISKREDLEVRVAALEAA